MRKVLLLIIAVIILVSLTWFRTGHAQTPDPVLGKRSKAELVKAYQENGGVARDLKVNLGTNQGLSNSLNPQQYASPELFDTSSMRPDTMLFQSKANTYPTHSTKIPFDSLKPFGQVLFNSPRETTPPVEMAAASDYLLGPGDNLVMRLLGRSENEYNLTVDREGKVYIPRIGELVVWGLTVDAFKRTAEQKLAAVYTDFQITVSLGKIRSIRIYLTGEVRFPGAYTVSSLTSLFNALYLAGGPTVNGSMRDIRLMRSGKAVATVDLYRFLLVGDNTSDVRLETGDAIFVPVAGPRVAIRGEIRRPAIYEIRPDETITNLLSLSGNPTAEAHLERVMLERIADGDQRQVIDLNLEPQHTPVCTEKLTDGDRVTVYSMFDARKNTVGIFGKVKHPGYYQKTESTRISDLLGQGQLQDFDVHLDRANIFRRHSDWRTEIVAVNLRAVLTGDTSANILLSDRDSLVIYSIQDLKWKKSVQIMGEVQTPGMYPLYDNMTAADLVFLAGSYTRSAATVTGELARLDSLGNVVISRVDLASSDGSKVTLQDNDQLFIRRIPEWQLHRTISLDGEIAFPGEYVLSDHEETLYDMLNRAGGFTATAFPSGIILQRPSIAKTIDRMQIGAVLDKSNPIIRDTLGNLTRSKVFELDTMSVSRIALDVNAMLKSKGKSFNITLKPGDKIFVPSIPTGISVLGAVGANGTIMYKENKSVKYYVDHAGSFAAEADKKGTRLIKANGMVFAGGSTLGRKVEMGDVIVVPTKVKTERDFGRTLTSVTGAAAGILGSILVISKL